MATGPGGVVWFAAVIGFLSGEEARLLGVALQLT
jgi:hypothetical protein